MHFPDFIKLFDQKNVIILLEGKRKVLSGDDTMMVCRNNHVPFIDQSTWFDWLKS